MVEVKAEVKKGDSRAVLDIIVAFCKESNLELVPYQRGIFDEPDSHYTLVWINIPKVRSVPLLSVALKHALVKFEVRNLTVTAA